MIRSLFLCFVFFLPVIANPIQAQVVDDFTDMDFLQNPEWTGDTGQFRINTYHQLQLKSAGADTSFLSTRNEIMENTEWNFWMKLSFNTSANNHARIYLTSDIQDLSKPLQGYFLQVGGSDDSVYFCRQDGADTTRLFKATRISTGHSTNPLRIRMTHDSTWTWRLFCDSTGGTNFSEEGNCLDDQVRTTAWFGVFCKYTSSNSAKFYFDDFSVKVIVNDTLPPFVTSATVRESNKIELIFSEKTISTTALSQANYSTQFSGQPIHVYSDETDPQEITLEFQQDFPDGAMDTLTIHEIRDMQGNLSGEIQVPFSLYYEKSYDVLITEIMADPEPAVGLPACEYVELYNRTKYPISINGWTFNYGIHSKILPDTTIGPRSFLLLTRGDSLKEYGPCIDLFTSVSSLTNDGSSLALLNAAGKAIHSVTYSPGWFQPVFKGDGGWSLEMIDTGNPCGCSGNWGASVSPQGGTPGQPNSIRAENPDTEAPYLKRARIEGLQRAEVFFSEPMDSLGLNDIFQWNCDQGFGHPDGISLVPPDFSCVKLTFAQSFQPGILYTISIRENPTDCAGNRIDTAKRVFVAIPDQIQPEDVIINEILTNPVSGGERFVEVFNRSQKVIDLKEVQLGSMDTVTNTVDKPADISESEFLFFPAQYLVLTKNPADIQARYFSPNPEAFLQLSSMITLPDDDGEVALIRKNDGIFIDRVRYSKDMQFPLLNYRDGVSLERIDPMVSSSEKTNWHSASENCGFATPGYRNSQFMELNAAKEWVTIAKTVFSPDDDGKDDFLSLVLNPGSPGYSASVVVFDGHGRKVRTLANNLLISTAEVINWNGLDDLHQRADVGIYLVYIEFLNPDGGKKVAKKAIVLAGRF
jgi:hypothetical protein